jgi:Flp pilus assembly protein TadG
MTKPRVWKALKSFLCTGDGSATVEFTLWVPVFLGILLLGADSSIAFTRQSNLWRVSHETARIVSRHAMDANEGAAFARNQMQLGDYTPEVEVMVDDAAQVVTILVRADPRELAPLGILSFALGDRISITVSQALEPI